MKGVNATTVCNAMGHQEGDYIELHNQWAKVFVTREGGRFRVTGDLPILLRTDSRAFNTLTAAMIYAFKSLAEYQKGAFR